jgi:hypothetical protein
LSDHEKSDRSPPHGLFLSSISFFDTAKLAHSAYDNGELNLLFNEPIYYLYCHTMELAMKGYLRAKGMSEKELSRHPFGHSLLNLWQACLKRQLVMDEQSMVPTVIGKLDQYTTGKYKFRYVRIGVMDLLSLDDVRTATTRLIEAVSPCIRSWLRSLDANPSQ